MAGTTSSLYFLRSYVALAAAILVIALALDGVIAWLIPEAPSSQAAAYAPTFALIESRLQAVTDQPSDGQGESLTRAFAATQDELQTAIDLPLALIDVADFTGQDSFLQTLVTGEIVSLYDSADREILYHQIADSSFILALGPLPAVSSAGGSIETFVIVSYYVLVAIILFLWVRPFYRDLGSLRHAASRFGRDDFATRVKVADGSSILPVAESFNRMAERIQYLVTAHHDLTNAVAHELRTPLARFKFSMEILNNTNDVDKKAAYLASMKTDVQELEELIDEMLTYAQLSEENLQLSRTSLAVDLWLQQQVAQYPASPIPIECRFQPLLGDDNSNATFNPDMLARALHNIIRNCLRYAGSVITVTGTIAGGRVTLRVADDGPGIPDDKHAAVLEPFARLDTSRDRKSGGYGLGLAIAQRILQRHGGSIHVENNTPHGAVFVLQWPRVG